MAHGLRLRVGSPGPLSWAWAMSNALTISNRSITSAISHDLIDQLMAVNMMPEHAIVASSFGNAEPIKNKKTSNDQQEHRNIKAKVRHSWLVRNTWKSNKCFTMEVGKRPTILNNMFWELVETNPIPASVQKMVKLNKRISNMFQAPIYRRSKKRPWVIQETPAIIDIEVWRSGKPENKN